ncbi:MAG: polyphosphate polymerase domain-containing protein [Flavobacteriales bacterium]|nr:polyphosphate polymerase domain-containing protein [Flavobacteriales bacterium]
MSNDLLEQMNAILRPFTKLGLGQFGDDRFAERRDRKFPCDVENIGDIIKGLYEHYDLVVPVENPVSSIGTLYFDTPEFDFYREHHRGKSNRHKVRFRKYPDTKTSFLEIKKKSPKGITLKERVESPFQLDSIDQSLEAFLGLNGIDAPNDLTSVLEVNYQRYSFISKDREERFSVDFAVEFSDGKKSGTFGSLAIFEVKQPRYMTSPIVKRLRQNGIREKSLSKYCLSLSTLKPKLKSNRFKPALRNLQALFHAQIHTSNT